jgi:hypothetical protein
MRHWLCCEAHLLFTVQDQLLAESSSTIRIETDAMSEESLEYILKGFPGTRYFPKFKLTTWHPKGVLDQPLADKLVAFIEWEEYIQAAPFDRYADLSGLTEIRVSLDHVLDTAQRRRFVPEPVKTALFAEKPNSLELAQTYERLMEGAVITVRAFSDRQTAAEWLEVPPSILQPPAAA